ncbi:SMC-Scp complex subunit ScpB [Glaciecola petra]|uniref:SMC-Scp complex subunit ScpB n=1 Tax=Glaciecola petra TaxID=3075602 RepID=A0ABU2ZQ93_9ALTE|nr:SMC-Scp complex subunit ScpB [Aestuariibacter sp. P117]MDT0594591.1 SMC-Scp complex subunit ScpB [Aestuariibacter sp. P117]
MNKISDEQLKQLLEAAIFVCEGSLSVDRMRNTILSDLAVSSKQLNKALKDLELDYAARGIRLVKVASGYRFQSDSGLGQILSRLWQETVPKYSRAMLETLALIAYRQPITRGEIEDVRGVAVSSNIIRTLTERKWIKVVGHKEVPGRPSLFATTPTFLDYFSLKSLSELPSAESFVENIEAAVEASEKANIDHPQDDLLQNEIHSDTDKSDPNKAQIH